MRAISNSIRRGLCLLALLCAATAQAQQTLTSVLTPPEQRGKHIYLRGESPAGRALTAYLGGPDNEVPAATLPCAGCHGLDGRGKPEGGVTPSVITWESLTKGYGHQHPSGRAHPAFTERSLARALTAGEDAAGNPLAVAMPRYRLADEDMADLLAYLKRLGTDHDAGVTDATLTLGTLLPLNGPQAALGQAVKEVLTAYCAALNAQGGLYQRRVELRVLDSSGPTAEVLARLQQTLARAEVFAFVGTHAPGAEAEVAALLAEAETPLIGPLSPPAPNTTPFNRQVFYLFSGLAEQAQALLRFAAREPKQTAVIVHPADARLTAVATALAVEGKRSGWENIVTLNYENDAAQLAARLQQRGVNAVFWLGTAAQAAALLQQAERLQWQPRLLLPGALAGKALFDAPACFKARVYLAYPTLPADHTAAGVAGFRALLAEQRVAARHSAAQLTAYSAAHLLSAALKRAGREVTREKLSAVLEGFYEFETGLTPRLSYHANRRIGALGAYIVALDPVGKTFVPSGGWIKLD